MKNNGGKTTTDKIAGNSNGLLQFNQTLKLHTYVLNQRGSNENLKKYSQITIYLVSSKPPFRPKIVASTLIALH